jgi:hypothetical protein
MSDMLIHQNPVKNGDVYDFSSKTYSFASKYVFRQLIEFKRKMLVIKARDEFRYSTFHDRNDGNEFKILCLHGFKISGVEFHAQPLTEGAQSIKVTFPSKQVLAVNWRAQKNYLATNVLYIPPNGNLESGDSFCLIEISKRWTLVIIQCTIAETHPVKQNGVKIIHDCYTKNAELNVDDTVIIFMIPESGRLNTEQAIVSEEQKGTSMLEVNRFTVGVTAQYKIENKLATVNDVF